MKATIPILVLLASTAACRTIVLDENGWPIGVAEHAPGVGPRSSSTARQAMAAESAPATLADPMTPGAQGMATADSQAPLYGWDGEAVDGARPTQGAPSHGLGPGEGRMRIIELYQQVLDERDALRDDLEAMTAALDGAQRQIVELEEQTRTLQARIVDLEHAQESTQAENIDLAARLTTAQIRRLEAEKLLLENRIQALRSAEASEASMSGTSESMSGARAQRMGDGS